MVLNLSLSHSPRKFIQFNFQELQKCFESQNIPLLQETISKMPESEAVYHMKRCIDSGLWVPDANKNKNEEGERAEADGQDEEDSAGGSGDKTL